MDGRNLDLWSKCIVYSVNRKGRKEMTSQEWKALERMVKGKDPMIIHTNDGKVSLEYIRSGTMEYYELILPYGTATLYESSPLHTRSRAYLKELYESWYNLDFVNKRL